MRRFGRMHGLQKSPGVVNRFGQQRELGRQSVPDDRLKILAHRENPGPQHQPERVVSVWVKAMPFSLGAP